MTIRLFVHIPKTAGTSFRLGAEQALGADRIVYDYGAQSPETSVIAQKHIYQNQDFWAFYSACYESGAALVGGHMNCNRFVNGFGVENIITFVREPLQRIASEYQHFVRVKGYKGSFREFYSQSRMHNRLSRAFKEVPLISAGFVGVTERYNESLDMLNELTGFGVSRREDNLGGGSIGRTHHFGEEELRELKEFNRTDLIFYRRCLVLFEERWQLFCKGQPYVHGLLTQVKASHVGGWAWWAGLSDQPVVVDIAVNGQLQGRVIARDFAAHLCRLNPPRGGYVSFQLPLKLTSGDRVSCTVSETGQLLGDSVFSAPTGTES
uniref:sulfotransferase family 2 domain-containing protein n=1 Tax=Marinobacterium profundum TaxID=1714300 RepID=UPI000829E32A|nr:sulfotransferase family 2 domain-containing protein [Marinobacterium profundum]